MVEKPVRANILNNDDYTSFFSFMMPAKLKEKGLLCFYINVSCHNNYLLLLYLLVLVFVTPVQYRRESEGHKGHTR